MSSQDYSWIKPGVLAVVVGTSTGINDGVVVKVITTPFTSAAINTWTGERTWAIRAGVTPVTPARFGPYERGDVGWSPRCAWLRPLDFPEEADIQEVSRDMEIVG